MAPAYSDAAQRDDALVTMGKSQRSEPIQGGQVLDPG